MSEIDEEKTWNTTTVRVVVVVSRGYRGGITSVVLVLPTPLGGEGERHACRASRMAKESSSTER